MKHTYCLHTSINPESSKSIPNLIALQSLFAEALHRILRTEITIRNKTPYLPGMKAKKFVFQFQCDLEKLPDQFQFKMNRFLSSAFAVSEVYPLETIASDYQTCWQFFISPTKTAFMRDMIFCLPVNREELCKLAITLQNESTDIKTNYHDPSGILELRMSRFQSPGNALKFLNNHLSNHLKPNQSISSKYLIAT